jgi:hypothetical protein
MKKIQVLLFFGALLFVLLGWPKPAHAATIFSDLGFRRHLRVEFLLVNIWECRSFKSSWSLLER